MTFVNEDETEDLVAGTTGLDGTVAIVSGTGAVIDQTNTTKAESTVSAPQIIAAATGNGTGEALNKYRKALNQTGADVNDSDTGLNYYVASNLDKDKYYYVVIQGTDDKETIVSEVTAMAMDNSAETIAMYFHGSAGSNAWVAADASQASTTAATKTIASLDLYEANAPINFDSLTDATTGWTKNAKSSNYLANSPGYEVLDDATYVGTWWMNSSTWVPDGE